MMALDAERSKRRAAIVAARRRAAVRVERRLLAGWYLRRLV